jgi:hypothetical protein
MVQGLRRGDVTALAVTTSGPKISATIEGRGLEPGAQLAGVAPGLVQLCARRPTSNLRISVSVFRTRRVAEVIRMELRHDIHRRRRRMLGDPVKHRLGATCDVIRHHEVADCEILAPIDEQRDVARHGLPVPRGL